MAVLDLSKYVENIGTFDQAEVEKALRGFSRMMEAGVHEVTIKEIMELPEKPGVPAGIIQMARDPQWIQFCVLLENATGEQSRQYIMCPVTNTVAYTNPDTGKPSFASYRTFNSFIAALGFEPEFENEASYRWFLRQVAKTNGEFLKKLVGFQLKLVLSWRKGTVHPHYSADEKVYYMVDENGHCPSEELAEPFTPDTEKKGADRWAEMAIKAKRANLIFTQNMDAELRVHDSVENPLQNLVDKAVKKPLPKTLPVRPPMATKKQDIEEALGVL